MAAAGITAWIAGEKWRFPARPSADINCLALGKSLADHITNLVKSLFTGRLSSIVNQISCKTILMFAEHVCLLKNRLRDRVWYCWSFLFFMFQNSFVIILYFAMLFITTAIFKTLEFSFVWNVEKLKFNSSQNDSNLHQNRIILSSEWGRICLPSKVTLTI